MKKNPGRKERRRVQFQQQDKFEIAKEALVLKNKILKNKKTYNIITQHDCSYIRNVKIHMGNLEKHTRNGLCQIKAFLKQIVTKYNIKIKK